MPADAVIARLADSSDPSAALTLIVQRSTRLLLDRVDQAHRPAARRRPPSGRHRVLYRGTRALAEVAFAVADAFQGKGLATMLLERLAVLASQHGFQRFQASTLADNQRDARGLPRLRLRDPLEDRAPASSTCSCR